MKDLTILQKYNSKVLGKGAYKDGPEYSAEKLANPDEAYLIFWEIFNHEGYLTQDGINFLKEYYTLSDLALILSEKGGFDDYKTQNKIADWLTTLEKETSEHGIT